jgi:hypothetical protein
MHAPRKRCIVQRIKREGFVPRCSVLRELRNVGGVSLRNGPGGGDARSALVLARDLALPPILSLLLLLLRLKSRMKWTLRTQQPEDSSKVTRPATEFCAVPTARLRRFLYFKCGIVPFLTPPRTGWRRCFSMRGYPPHSTHSQTSILSPATPKGKTGYLLKNQKYPERQSVVPQVRWV